MPDYTLTLTLPKRGDDPGWTATHPVLEPGARSQIAEVAIYLYRERNPDEPLDIAAELDEGFGAAIGDRIEFYSTRVRFARRPTRGGQPRWGRWHMVTVERQKRRRNE